MLRNIHFSPVKAIRFAFGNRVLASLSERDGCSQLVFSELEGERVLFSRVEAEAVLGMTVDCSVQSASWVQSIFVYSSRHITQIRVMRREATYNFSVAELRLWRVPELGALTCVSTYAKADDSLEHFISGHADGSILFWQGLKFSRKHLRVPFPVRQLVRTAHASFCLLEGARLVVYDARLERPLKRIDFRLKPPFGTRFSEMREIVAAEDLLLMRTDNEDVLLYKLEVTAEGQQSMKQKAERLSGVFVLGHARRFVLESRTGGSALLYVVGLGGEVQMISCNEKRLVGRIFFQEPVLDLCICGDSLVVLLSGNRLAHICDQIQTESVVCPSAVQRLCWVG